MNNFLFIFLTIFGTTAISYMFYKVLLGAEKGIRENELQITSDELLEQLKILFKQNNHNIVQALAKNYLDKKKDNIEVRKIYAKSLYEDKKIYEAIDQAKIILNLCYNDIDIRLFLANCYEQVGKNNDAITLLQEILDHNPNNVLAIKNLAKIFLQINQRMSALKMYIKLQDFLENEPDKFKNLKMIASLYFGLRRYDYAINSYNDALAICPEDIDVKKKLVELYFEVQNTEEFVSLINDIKLNSGTADDTLWAMNKLLDYYLDIKDYDKALVIAKSLQENPLSDKVKIGNSLAIILAEKNEVDEGIEVLLNVAEMAPDDISLKKNLAGLYRKKCDFDTALLLYQKILDDIDYRQMDEVHKEMSDLYVDWAMYLFGQGDNEGCFKQFFSALEHYDKNSEIYFKLGEVNKTIKNFNESISQYKKAIEINPNNSQYYDALAESYHEIGSIYEEKACLLDSLKYSETNPNVFFKLGNLLQFQGDMDSAVSYMEKALQLDENYVDAMYKLALMYENIGKIDEAIILYENILEITPENEAVISCLKMLKE